MVRGADYSYLIAVKNRDTGQPVDDPELVNGIELVLTSSIDRQPFKVYDMERGIEELRPGVFRVEVKSADTLLLPLTGKAVLEGFTVPVKRPITLDLGVIRDNAINHQPNEQD